PFVEYQDGAEVLQLDDRRQQRIGKKVVDRGVHRVAGVARTKLPTRFAFDAARCQAEVELRVGRQKLHADMDQGGFGSRDSQVVQERGGERLIHQNPPVLRIVAKLDHVPVAVLHLQQMGLSAST